MPSWKSSSMNILPFAFSIARSFQEPVSSPILSTRQAMPVVYIAYGTVWADCASYHGSSKKS